MKNTLYDMHNLLFAQLEKLSDDDITGKALDDEVRRSKAMAAVSTVIVNNCNTILKARKAEEDNNISAPAFISIEDKT